MSWNYSLNSKVSIHTNYFQRRTGRRNWNEKRTIKYNKDNMYMPEGVTQKIDSFEASSSDKSVTLPNN